MKRKVIITSELKNIRSKNYLTFLKELQKKYLENKKMSEYMCNKCGQDLDSKDEECPVCNGEQENEKNRRLETYER